MNGNERVGGFKDRIIGLAAVGNHLGELEGYRFWGVGNPLEELWGYIPRV